MDEPVPEIHVKQLHKRLDHLAHAARAHHAHVAKVVAALPPRDAGGPAMPPASPKK